MKKLINLKIKELIHFLRTSETAFIFIFSILVGLGGGYGAVVFRWMIHQFKELFFTGGAQVFSYLGEYYVIIIPAIGGLIIGLLIYFFAKETKGHGVPEVIQSVALSGGKIRFRVSFIKALVSSIFIGAGGSVGREGPIVQIGSSLGSSLGQIFYMSKDKIRILVACGAAAGITATFNTPLAGIFFALEVILRNYSPRHFASIVISAVVATIVSRHYLGDTPAFLTPAYELKSLWSYPMFVILGFLAAIVAFLFTKALYKTEDLFEKIKIPEYVKPAVGGLMIGIIGLYYPQIFGVGYETINIVLSQSIGLKLALTLLVLKTLATSLSLGSGGSGGVFAPSLFIGAMLGVAFSYIVKLIMPDIAVSPGAYALLGMGAVFAGAAQAPISAILILFEMTGNYKIILPLITVCIISAFIVRKWSEFSIYTLKIKRKGININKLTTLNLLEDLQVGDSMSREVITLLPNNTIKEAGLQIKNTHHRGFPVINEQHKLIGIITYNDINKYLRDGKEKIPVSEVMTRDLIKCYPDENLRMALEKMGEKDIGRIPVVEHRKQDIMLGLITRKNIITACNKAINKRNLEIFGKDSTLEKNISKLFL